MAPQAERPLAPGSRIGILGGGQLGRMLAVAAAKLGLRAHIYCPAGEAPAVEVAWRATRADYDDEAALAQFADSVDAVTYEFENIPAETVEVLAAHAPVRPSLKALATAQDRLTEKTFLQSQDIPTAPFRAIDSLADLEAAIEDIGTPAVLKTRRFGYDGKGQAKIAAPADARDAFESLGGTDLILEGFVPFEREVSVVAARGMSGEMKAYDLVENRHVDHILSQTQAPATVDGATAQQAGEIAASILDALGYIGVIGVEMFLMPETSAGPRLIVNEIAPRVHNSGHWTLDACLVSQFEQHIRAVAGWPLGTPARHSDAVMTNLIGADAEEWAKLAAEPGASLTLYGKSEIREGRKMGHVTRLSPKSEG